MRSAAGWFVLAGVACGGSADVPAAATPAADATSGAAGDALQSPSGDSAANPTQVCPDIEDVIALCESSACAQAVVATCETTIAPGFSEAFATALHARAPTVACVDGLDPSTACMAPKPRAAAPTGAQKALADAFCPACANAPATTEGGLGCVGHVLPAGSTGRMLSTTLLELSDAMIEKVFAAGCIAPAAKMFPADYDNCENVFLNCVVGQFPPFPACADDQ